MKGSRRQGTAVALIALLLCHLPHPGVAVPVPAEIQAWLSSQDCMGLYPAALPTTNLASEVEGDGGTTTSAAFRPALWTNQIAVLRSGSRATGRNMLGKTASGTTQMRGMAATAVATSTAVQAAQDRALAALDDLYAVEGDLKALSDEIDAYVARTGMVPLSIDAVINDVLGGGTAALPADRVRLVFDRLSKVLVLTLCIELPALFEAAGASPGRKLAQAEVDAIAGAVVRTLLQENNWLMRGLGIVTAIAIAVAATAVVAAAAPVVGAVATAAFAGSASVVGATTTLGTIVAGVGLSVVAGEVESAAVNAIADRYMEHAQSTGDPATIESAKTLGQGLGEGKLFGDLVSSLVSGYYGGVKRTIKGFKWWAKGGSDIGNAQTFFSSVPDMKDTFTNFKVPPAGTFKSPPPPPPDSGGSDDAVLLSPPPPPSPTQEVSPPPDTTDDTAIIPTSCGKDYSNIDAEYSFIFVLPIETDRCSTLAGRRELETEWKKVDPFLYPECAPALASGAMMESINRSCDCFACESGLFDTCRSCRVDTLSFIPKECRSAMARSTVPYSEYGFELGTMGDVYRTNMDECGIDY